MLLKDAGCDGGAVWRETPFLCSQHRSVVYMLYGMLAVLSTMGTSYLMIILTHCLVLYSVSLAKQKWLCFTAGLCSLASFKLEPFSTWQVGGVVAGGLISSSSLFPLGLQPGHTPLRWAKLKPLRRSQKSKQQWAQRRAGGSQDSWGPFLALGLTQPMSASTWRH